MTDPTQVVSFRLEPDTIAELRDIANAQGCTVSDLLRRGALMAMEEPNRMVVTWTIPPTVTVNASSVDVRPRTPGGEGAGMPEAAEMPSGGPQTIADIAVSSAGDTGLITVALSGVGVLVEGDLDYDRAGELRDMLADAMAHIGVAPHSGNPQMTCAEAEQAAVDMRAKTVEQFRRALLDGLDQLERHNIGRYVSPGDVADLVHRVAAEVGR